MSCASEAGNATPHQRLDLELLAAARRKAKLDRKLRRRGIDVGSTCANLLEEMRELTEIRSHERLQNCIFPPNLSGGLKYRPFLFFFFCSNSQSNSPKNIWC